MKKINKENFDLFVKVVVILQVIKYMILGLLLITAIIHLYVNGVDYKRFAFAILIIYLLISSSRLGNVFLNKSIGNVSKSLEYQLMYDLVSSLMIATILIMQLDLSGINIGIMMLVIVSILVLWFNERLFDDYINSNNDEKYIKFQVLKLYNNCLRYDYVRMSKDKHSQGYLSET